MNSHILQKGIDIAKNLDSTKYRLVAIITDKKNRILSIGHNSYSKSHPRQAYYSEKCGNGHQIYLHAELHAITKLKYTDKPYAIYIARTNQNGKSLLARPCSICKQAISDIGIKKIYYTKS